MNNEQRQSGDGAEASAAPRKPTDAEVAEWAERHDLRGSATDLRCAFEDAKTLHLASDVPNSPPSDMKDFMQWCAGEKARTGLEPSLWDAWKERGRRAAAGVAVTREASGKEVGHGE